jgi:hypothetical protein
MAIDGVHGRGQGTSQRLETHLPGASIQGAKKIDKIAERVNKDVL